MATIVVSLVSIVLLTSAVGTRIAAIAPMELHTSHQVVAQCGKNVTLTCNVSSLAQIMRVMWVGGNISSVCTSGEGNPGAGGLCESKTEAPNKYSYSLTLTNMMPVMQGEYICKLYSILGTEYSKTYVTVRECLGSFNSSRNASHIECRFSGVYPSGTIHWVQGSDNLTDSAITQEEEDLNGLYNLRSILKIQPGKPRRVYNCSLWIPAFGNYPIVREVHSSGGVLSLQWICIVLGPFMVTFITSNWGTDNTT